MCRVPQKWKHVRRTVLAKQKQTERQLDGVQASQTIPDILPRLEPRMELLRNFMWDHAGLVQRVSDDAPEKAAMM